MREGKLEEVLEVPDVIRHQGSVMSSAWPIAAKASPMTDVPRLLDCAVLCTITMVVAQISASGALSDLSY